MCKVGRARGVQSDEVICLLAGSSFDSLCPSQAPRCQSHPWVVLCKARAQMLVSAVGGSSGSGCQCWLGVWAAPPGSAVNAGVTALSPSLPCVRNPCLSLHTQASTRFPYCQILCSSESKFLHHSLDILLLWFHHIIPWRFFFFLRFPNLWFMESLGWPTIEKRPVFPIPPLPLPMLLLHATFFSLFSLLFLTISVTEGKGHPF